MSSLFIQPFPANRLRPAPHSLPDFSAWQLESECFCPETLCTESVKWSVYRLYSICHYLKIHSYSWDLRSKINVLRPTNFNRSATLLGIFLQALHFWKQHLISCRFCSNKENEFTWCVRFVSCIRRCNDGLHASSHLIPRMCMFSES